MEAEAAEAGCTTCLRAVQIFLSANGAFAGCATLHYLPTSGGLFIAGGLAPRFLDLISDPDWDFLTSYHSIVGVLGDDAVD